MQFFTLAATLLAGTALASPSARNIQGRTVQTVQVRFQGAPADVAYFDQYVPVDGTQQPVYNDLSISHIETWAPSNVECHAHGIDNSDTYVAGTNTVDVGPPQEQTWVACYYI